MALLVCLLLIGVGTLPAQAPWIDPAEDEKHLGPPRPLSWTLHQKVAGFRNYDKIFPVRTVPAGDSVFPLPEANRELGSLEFPIKGENLTVDEYFVRSNVAGLLVIQYGEIDYERYGLGNTAETRWVSYSVASR